MGERILGTQRISWNPRGEVISLMRDEEAALSLSLLFCFSLSSLSGKS